MQPITALVYLNARLSSCPFLDVAAYTKEEEYVTVLSTTNAVRKRGDNDNGERES